VAVRVRELVDKRTTTLLSGVSQSTSYAISAYTCVKCWLAHVASQCIMLGWPSVFVVAKSGCCCEVGAPRGLHGSHDAVNAPTPNLVAKCRALSS
jgi:hypothetical protein